MRVARGPVEGATDAESESEPVGRVVVDETQRRRSRFRTRTDANEDIGVVVDNARVLSAGDLLETDDGDRFLVELEAVEALVVEFANDGERTEPAAMVVAGHAVGNRHWDLVAHEGRIYVPTGGDAEGRRALFEPYLPAGATVDVEAVDPSLFDESQAGDAHSHDDGDDGHTHERESGHDHEHEHTNGHEHDHEHSHAHTGTPMRRDQLRRKARGQEATDE